MQSIEEESKFKPQQDQGTSFILRGRQKKKSKSRSPPKVSGFNYNSIQRASSKSPTTYENKNPN